MAKVGVFPDRDNRKIFMTGLMRKKYNEYECKALLNFVFQNIRYPQVFANFSTQFFFNVRMSWNSR